MHKTNMLIKHYNGTATEEEIQLLKHGLVSGKNSIGENVNHSTKIIGNSNTVELTLEALNRLNTHPLFKYLDRGLTGKKSAPIENCDNLRLRKSTREDARQREGRVLAPTINYADMP